MDDDMNFFDRSAPPEPPPPDDEYSYGNVVAHPAAKARSKRELVVTQFPELLPAQIPPRRWAYGHFLLFGSAAVLGAVDGGGKGTIVTTMCLSMITGEALLEEKVWRNGPVAIITYEDDEIEWLRRFAAACIHYNLPYGETIQHVHFIHCNEGRVVFARSADGRITHPDSDGITDALKEIGAVLLVIDPYNHAHELEDGNSNAMMAKVAGEMSRVARETDAAVLVLHHLRKGSNGAADDLMGATSVRATFRSCRILSRMDVDTAKKMNIEDPWRYTRIAGTKENYAPPPEKSKWFKIASVSLGNATEDYPEGDSIGVATTWQARPMFEGMDGDQLTAVFAAYRSRPHGVMKQGRQVIWAGIPLVDIGKRSEREASTILAQWLDNGVLTKEDYVTETRNKASRVVLDEAKVSAILNDLAVTGMDLE
jgi:hypothetical protein